MQYFQKNSEKPPIFQKTPLFQKSNCRKIYQKPLLISKTLLFDAYTMKKLKYETFNR